MYQTKLQKRTKDQGQIFGKVWTIHRLTPFSSPLPGLGSGGFEKCKFFTFLEWSFTASLFKSDYKDPYGISKRSRKVFHEVLAECSREIPARRLGEPRSVFPVVPQRTKAWSRRNVLGGHHNVLRESPRHVSTVVLNKFLRMLRGVLGRFRGQT